jgi:hypothetical protein
LAAIHNRDPIGELKDLVQLGGYKEDSGTGVTLADRLLVDELDTANVKAARWLIENQ